MGECSQSHLHAVYCVKNSLVRPLCALRELPQSTLGNIGSHDEKYRIHGNCNYRERCADEQQKDRESGMERNRQKDLILRISQYLLISASESISRHNILNGEGEELHHIATQHVAYSITSHTISHRIQQEQLQDKRRQVESKSFSVGSSSPEECRQSNRISAKMSVQQSKNLLLSGFNRQTTIDRNIHKKTRCKV